MTRILRCGPERPTARLLACALASVTLTLSQSVVAEEIDSLQLRSFDKAWSLIDQRYWDPEFGGLDWPAVRDELRPRAAEASTNAELRDVLDEMISRLGQSHFGVIPAVGDSSAGEELDDATSCTRELTPRVKELIADDRRATGSATPGFEFRFIEGEALITQVDEGGPAGAAGIRPGWTVLSVDGQRIEALAECLGSELDRRALEALVYRLVGGLLTGEAGDEVSLRLRSDQMGSDAGDLTSEITLELTIPADVQSVKFGNLPSVDFRFANRVLELPPVSGEGASAGEALLLSFNIWMLPVVEAFEEALLEGLQRDSVRGVVLDLRGNPGGVAGLSAGLGGYFVREAESLGTLRYRTSTLHLRINPRLVSRDDERIEPYDGPVVILIDQFSASTTEIFAAGMQDLERAHVIGERSMGAALPAVIERLPNGDLLMHAMADLERPNGKRVEGVGVEPDEVVPRTREGLREGRDEPLEAALRWLAQQASTAGEISASDAEDVEPADDSGSAADA